MKKIKTIYPNKKSIYFEIGIGIIGLIMFLTPGLKNIFVNYTILGFPISPIVIIASIITIIYGVYRLLTFSKYPNIDIFETSIKIDDFEANFEDLTVRRKDNIWIFINKNVEKKYDAPLNKKDFEYIQKGFKE